MLRGIQIDHFAVAERVDIEVGDGMTVITGETGAGKSILLDALSLALGDRADSSMVQPGHDKARICVYFEIDQHEAVKQWLDENDIPHEGELIIRRMLSIEGRTRALMNGHPVTTGQLKGLGELLVQVHGQNQHQLLTKNTEQLRLLDDFAQHESLQQQVKTAYAHFAKLSHTKKELEQKVNQEESHIALLKYQVEELDALKLEENELAQLDKQHQLLTHASALVQISAEIRSLLSQTEEVSIEKTLHIGIRKLEPFINKFEHLGNISALLNNALIQIEEADAELDHFQSQIAFDDELFTTTEQRLSTLHDVARKHRVAPEALYAHHQGLIQALQDIEQASIALAKIDLEIEAALETYQAAATLLTGSRKKAAHLLSSEITECIKPLGMQDGQFCIQFENVQAKPSANGNDHIVFCFSGNVGHPLKPLTKVASGGEMSRISLAIQLITARSLNTPTLLFDEVDAGIGGEIGSRVGKALRALGHEAQVLCVTHLPQVAAEAHHHFYVNKAKVGTQTVSNIRLLNAKDRLTEIARMLGGESQAKDSALLHAKKLLEQTS